MTSGPVPGPNGVSAGVPVPANATLTWDAENRLIEAVVGSVTIAYAYDHQSRLIAATVGGVTTRYLYDGWNRIAEYEQNGTGHELKRGYLWGMDMSGSMQGAGGVGGLLAMTVHDTTTATFYPTYDGNGNVSEYINESGTDVAHFEYDPFGNLTVDRDSNANQFPYRFSTKPQDLTTGLLYYGYRWYDPVTGRWPSRDPIEEEGGINLYGFVGNDGGNWWDYLGMKGNGHHIIPWSIFNDVVSKKVNKFFDSDVARIFHEHYTKHNYKNLNNISHAEYNGLVKKYIQEFLGEKQLKNITLREARRLLHEIKRLPATHPIGNFNRGVIDEAVDEIVSKLGRNAEVAARKSLEEALEKGAQAARDTPRLASKRAGPIGIVISGYFLVDSMQANGVGNAVVDEMIQTVDPLGSLDLPFKLPQFHPANGMGDWIRLSKVVLNHTAPQAMGAKICSDDNLIEIR